MDISAYAGTVRYNLDWHLCPELISTIVKQKAETHKGFFGHLRFIDNKADKKHKAKDQREKDLPSGPRKLDAAPSQPNDSESSPSDY